MKVTLKNDEVLEAVRASLERQGLKVPDGTDPFRVSYDDAISGLTIEVDGVTVSPVTVETVPMPKARTVRDRFDPGPRPPTTPLTEPDRVLPEETETFPTKVQNERGIRSIVAASKELVSGTKPINHEAHYRKYGRETAVEDIAEFGKDPTDFKDEL
jgi:hypothetical protein